ADAQPEGKRRSGASPAEDSGNTSFCANIRRRCMKKKLIALLLALSIALALAACGGNNTTADTAGNNTAGNDTAGNTQQTDDGGDAAGADITIGMICIHDQNSGYDV